MERRGIGYSCVVLCCVAVKVFYFLLSELAVGFVLFCSGGYGFGCWLCVWGILV